MSQIVKKFIGANQVDDTKALLRNDNYLRARNAADSADVNVLKVNASDAVEFASFPQKSGTPSNNDDLVNKSYVDSAVSASAQVAKQSVRVVAASNLALTGGASLSVDGVSLANNDRILLAGQSTASQNGIYVVSGIGTAYSLARSSDADASAEVIPGMLVAVIEGTNYSNSIWALDTLGSITLGSTSLSFSKKTAKAKKEDLTLDGTDITNQYKDLALQVQSGSLNLSVDGVMQYEGSDYTLSTVSGVTRITFAGDLATGGNSALVATDILHCQYLY